MFQIKHYLNVAKLIAGDIMKSGSEADNKALGQWIDESNENKTIYNSIKKDGWYAENMEDISQFNTEKGWHKVQSRISTRSRTLKTIPKFYKYAAAASIATLITAGFWLINRETALEPQFTEPIIVNNQIKPGEDKATLTLETGELKILEKGTQFQTQNATSNGEEIIYNTINNSASRELVYNYLTIPRGGQFQMTLSDGTKVWLNSESQIKYPVNFIDGRSRQVELVYGEAYFDVSPSTEHKGSDFKVFHNHQEVQVLGTEFNIKAYKDETNIYTTLVEGKVSVTPSVSLRAQSRSEGQSQILAPNQQSNLDLKNNKISVTMVDVYNETSWKEGEFNFKKMPLKDIMKVLSRWYDMDVIFENKKLEEERFIGIIKKNESIEDILSSIKSTNSINNYEINNKTIIIK